MDLREITPLLITFNEISNIERTMAKLHWASRIVVVDSGSTDGTLDFLARDPRVEVTYNKFSSFAEQCNFGLTLIRTEWVLSLDADYELTDQLIEDLRSLQPGGGDTGFRARFVYKVFGHPLRGTLYPPRTVLYRPGSARYENQGHGHRVTVRGRVGELGGVIFHDDRKPLSRWLTSQIKYAPNEAEHLLQADDKDLSTVDRLRRRAWLAPILVFIYVLTVNRALLDGRAGWFYALQRLLAEILIALEILERRMSIRRAA